MSPWKAEADRLVLLELWMTGRFKRRATQASAWSRLDGLPWTRLSSRANERELVPGQRQTIAKLLDRVWPDWRATEARFTAAKLLPTPVGWRLLKDQERISAATMLSPQRLHHKTAASIVGPDSKSGWTVARQAAVQHLDLTHDQILRMRPHRGMRLESGGQVLDAAAVVSVLSEVVISDRAIRDGLGLMGEPPALLITVENLGSYIDVSVPNDWLLVHIPGWHMTLLNSFLGLLPESTPWCHWGDLDPKGHQILRSLRAVRADVKWVCPQWWPEIAPMLPGADWSTVVVDPRDPPLLHQLVMAGAWLEQESITCDSRICSAIAQALERTES